MNKRPEILFGNFTRDERATLVSLSERRRATHALKGTRNAIEPKVYLEGNQFFFLIFDLPKMEETRRSRYEQYRELSRWNVSAVFI